MTVLARTLVDPPLKKPTTQGWSTWTKTPTDWTPLSAMQALMVRGSQLPDCQVNRPGLVPVPSTHRYWTQVLGGQELKSLVLSLAQPPTVCDGYPCLLAR